MSQAIADSPEDRHPAPRRRPFREAALASGLVSGSELDAAAAGALGAVPGASDAASPEESQRQLDEAMARLLVERHILTRFQARELLAGRTRFRLGQYTVIDEIGRGGMGQVFKAEHALMGRQVAVKVLPRAKATPESEAAFRREMRILGRLDHENLVRAFDAGYDAQVYYLVTELVPGLDLRRQVRKHGPLDVAAAASVFTQAARALAFAHGQGLVHRDVKPGNILVMDDGRVKLLDLGLAGSSLEAEALQLGRVVGTMDYIAPEQIRTPDAVGPPADIYALGCSMYFTLTGEVPFPGGSRKDKMRRHLSESPVPIQRLAPHLPQPFCQVVEAMMMKPVKHRIGSADELITRLARWVPDRPVPLPRKSRAHQHSSASGPAPDWESESESCDHASERAGLGSSGDAGAAAQPVDTGSSVDFDAAVQPRARIPIAAVVRAIVPAALAGAAFTAALHAVRLLDIEDFDRLFRNVKPAMCGGAVFFLVAATQAAGMIGGRHR